MWVRKATDTALQCKHNQLVLLIEEAGYGMTYGLRAMIYLVVPGRPDGVGRLRSGTVSGIAREVYKGAWIRKFSGG